MNYFGTASDANPETSTLWSTDQIADIEGLKQGVGVIAELIFTRVNLQPAAPVLNMKERGFAHAAQRHNPAGDDDIGRIGMQLFVVRCSGRGEHLRHRVRRLEIIGIHDLSAISELGELLLADFDLLVFFCDDTGLIL